MVIKDVPFLGLDPGFDFQVLDFFEKLNPDGTHGTSDTQAIRSHRSDGDRERSHMYM
jgi:hypothetical protein